VDPSFVVHIKADDEGAERAMFGPELTRVILRADGGDGAVLGRRCGRWGAGRMLCPDSLSMSHARRCHQPWTHPGATLRVSANTLGPP